MTQVSLNTEIRGTHGTSVSKYESINSNGFSVSKTGQRGSGAYFWSYSTLEFTPYAKDLAISWWNFANKKGAYARDKKRNCCVIYCSFQVSKDDILDLEDMSIKESLIIYTNKIIEKLKAAESDKSVIVTTAHDMFIQAVEKHSGVKFKIIHGKVQRPKSEEQDLLIQLMGQPSCYIVKDVSCISISHHEELN